MFFHPSISGSSQGYSSFKNVRELIGLAAAALLREYTELMGFLLVNHNR